MFNYFKKIFFVIKKSFANSAKPKSQIKRKPVKIEEFRKTRILSNILAHEQKIAFNRRFTEIISKKAVDEVIKKNKLNRKNIIVCR